MERSIGFQDNQSISTDFTSQPVVYQSIQQSSNSTSMNATIQYESVRGSRCKKQFEV